MILILLSKRLLKTLRKFLKSVHCFYYYYYYYFVHLRVLHTSIHWSLSDGKSPQGSITLLSHHHPHVVPLARISLTLSLYFSQSFIASGRSSRLHPTSSHSCCMNVRAGRPAFARPYVRVHRSTSLMSSPLLLQQCPACLVHLTWIVFMMRGRWPYSWCFVGCCHQDLFNIARNILV